MDGRLLTSSRIDGGSLYLQVFMSKEVLPISDAETLSLVFQVIGIALTAIMVGIAIAKNNRH